MSFRSWRVYLPNVAAIIVNRQNSVPPSYQHFAVLPVCYFTLVNLFVGEFEFSPTWENRFSLTIYLFLVYYCSNIDTFYCLSLICLAWLCFQTWVIFAKFVLHLCFSLSDVTIGPNALWSQVQMSSLILAQGPTSTWRSSMSVCPTVSTNRLSQVENSPSSLPPTTLPFTLLLSSAPSFFSVSDFIASHCFLLPCPDNPLDYPFPPSFLPPGSHREPLMKGLFCTAFIIDALAVFPAARRSWLLGSRIAGG